MACYAITTNPGLAQANMYYFPLQIVEFTTQGALPLLRSADVKALLARLLEFYRQVGRFRLFAYCIHPKGIRFIVKEGLGYEFSSALEALRCNSEDMLASQLAKEGKLVDSVWHEFYQQKTIQNQLELQCALDELRHLPVHLGLAQHPADYFFSKTDIAAGLDLDQLARG